MSDEVMLRVAAIFPGYITDDGFSIVRMPERIMRRLGVKQGDYVEIVGRKTVYVEVWPVNSEDEDKDIVVMDEMTMRSVGIEIGNTIEIGDTVKVRKATLRPAQRVILAPLEPVRVDPEYLKKKVLLRKPVTKGQILRVRIRYTDGTCIYDELKEFAVVQVQPEPAAYVSVDTEVIVREESAKEPARE